MEFHPNKTVYNNLKYNIMKNILASIFIITFFSCKAQQQVLSMNTKGFSIEGVYYKDLDNELNIFEGTYTGTFENKTFIITLIKTKIHDPIGNYDQDMLIGKYRMLDSNGNQLYSTYNLADNKSKVKSLGFVEQTNKTKLRLMFGDLCIDGEIHLSFENPQKTLLHWKYFTNQTLVTDDSDCAPYNEMPRGEFTMIKQ